MPKRAQFTPQVLAFSSYFAVCNFANSASNANASSSLLNEHDSPPKACALSTRVSRPSLTCFARSEKLPAISAARQAATNCVLFPSARQLAMALPSAVSAPVRTSVNFRPRIFHNLGVFNLLGANERGEGFGRGGRGLSATGLKLFAQIG